MHGSVQEADMQCLLAVQLAPTMTDDNKTSKGRKAGKQSKTVKLAAKAVKDPFVA